MPTTAYQLTADAYQDVSGGAAKCSFRLLFIPSRENVLRLVLSPSLPDPDTPHYEEFRAPQDSGVEAHIVPGTDHVWLRTSRGTVRLVSFTQ